MCQNLPTTMTIFTMNTNIEMARSDGCQNLMFLALIRLIKRFRCPTPCKSHPPSLKAKVAVEAIKAHKTAAQIAQMFGVHPTQVAGRNRRWPVCRTSSATGASRCARIRHRKGRALQADRPTKSGAGLSQKKSWPHRLKNGADGSIPLIHASAFNSIANCWGVPHSTYYYQPRRESAEKPAIAPPTRPAVSEASAFRKPQDGRRVENLKRPCQVRLPVPLNKQRRPALPFILDRINLTWRARLWTNAALSASSGKATYVRLPDGRFHE
jgi:hypothetical protein